MINKILLSLAIGTVLTASSVVSARDQVDRGINRAMPANLQSLKMSSPLEKNGVDVTAHRAAMAASGDNGVIIRLVSPSVAEQKVRGKSAQKAKKNLQAEQADLLSEVMALDPNARVLGQTQLVLNAVFVEVNPSVLSELARHPGVLRIAPVANYELDLSETVPYIGATTPPASDYDGSGVRVAVLDSGIDYTHANMGGGGTLADYAAAWGAGIGDPLQTTRDGLFPTGKVVEGYDFVGELWPTSGPLAPDEDPIDFQGHGTHVADIIGGNGGVAPGASLYAVKVCSAVSTSCSGVALIQGMEYAVDPDGDGNPSDAVDIINMSLGSNYGQPFDDDLSAAVEGATGLGVLTVASAGNGGNKPYIHGTPAAAPTALAVAQTQVPSAFLPLIDVDGVLYQAVFQSWSQAPVAAFSAPVQYGDGAGLNLNGCAVFPAGSLVGKIVLVDRGACAFSIKISNIAAGGGLAGIIGLVDPSDPFDGAFGGGTPTIPGYMISQANSNAIKAQIGGPGIGTIDPDLVLPLVGQMVGSSSRGPQNESTTLIKPEIGAPGASVSAIVGSGTGEGPFGGTSGAAPMVAGSAALLLESAPNLSPLEAKAILMNNGETNIDTDPLTGLAPITRIGGGEVRVDRAVGAPAAAWDNNGTQGALSFGFIDVEKDTVNLFKTVRVRNYSGSDITYNVTPTFRYADDEATGAVSVQTPGKVKVKAGKDATFTVKMTINGAMLRGNYMNSGSEGANPATLTLNEYDGYIMLDDGNHPIHMAWHVLPRQASNVVGRQVLKFNKFGEDLISLTNNGVGTAQNDAYALIALSPNMPEGGLGQQAPMPDIRAVGINTYPVPAGFCSADESFIWAFAVNTWERQQHLLPVSFFIDLDTNQDGTPDYAVLNRDLSGLGTISDGRQVAWVYDYGSGGASAFFFAEHSTNTGNTVLLICGEQIGMNAANFFTNVNMDVYADDFYYGGPGDFVGGLTVAPLGEQYLGLPDDIAGKSGGAMTVIDFGPFPGNTAELGVMMIGNGDRGAGARGGSTQSTEALLFRTK